MVVVDENIKHLLFYEILTINCNQTCILSLIQPPAFTLVASASFREDKALHLVEVSHGDDP